MGDRSDCEEKLDCSQIARYLEPLFESWDIVLTITAKEKRENQREALMAGYYLPDIIIHKLGSEMGPNLVAVQVKGFWNKEVRTKDEEDLRKLWRKYKYKFLYRLELEQESFKLIPINPKL